jgi:transposase-like protein
MSQGQKLPQTLLEATRYFSDPEVCVQFVAKLRWPDGPTCPKCGGTEHSYLTTRRIWKCKACKKQFSVKAGSIFEDSAIPLDKWLVSIWLIANSKNGISSHELGRALGLTQKSSWFVLHRVRLAMQARSFEMLSGQIEVDETYIGQKARTMHRAERAKKVSGRGRSSNNKAVVLGMIERGGKVRAKVVDDVKRGTLQSYVRDAVEPGSDVFTDELSSYVGLDRDFNHLTINHAVQYVNGNVHTNYIENFWSLLKRGLHGTYISVQPFHLFRYLDERMFTFNERELDDFGRFQMVLRAVAGRRLTYAALTGKPNTAP